MLPETTNIYSDGIESYAVGTMPIVSSDWFYDRETDQYTGENLDVFTTGRVFLNFDGKTSTWTVDAQEEDLKYHTIGMGDTPFKAVAKAITDTKTTIFWDHSRIHDSVSDDLYEAERAIFRDAWPDKEGK